MIRQITFANINVVDSTDSGDPRGEAGVAEGLTSLQSQKAVTAYLKSKQFLPFGFAQDLHKGASLAY